MAKMKEETDEEHWQKHKKMFAWPMLILGALVLLNSWKGFIGWDYFIGIVLVLVAVMKITGCCKK